MEIKDVISSVLLQYKRGSRRRRIGLVIATEAGVVGWSLCNKTDRFNREEGLELALSRAEEADFMTDEERQKYYESAPVTMKKLINKMIDRSKKYYKTEINDND